MNQTLLYLSRADVESIGLEMPLIIELLEQAFIEKGKNQVEMPPKPGIHTRPDAFIHAMPAFIPAMKSAGIKWVAGYPNNRSYGLPYVSGLIILNDIETGFPYTVMDCTWITAYRTAGATALAAKYLARPDSQVLGILACGVQGRTNLEATINIFPIKLVYAYDIVQSVQDQFIVDIAEKYSVEVIGVEHPKEAVVNSDLVVTSGPILKHPLPTIRKDWLPSGSFASAIDFDSYWHPDALTQFDKLCTDDRDQFQYYRNIGYFQNTPDPYADLGEIVIGKKPGRERDEERTMAMNLGLAIDDMAIAPEIYQRAKQHGIGTELEL